MSKIMF